MSFDRGPDLHQIDTSMGDLSPTGAKQEPIPTQEGFIPTPVQEHSSPKVPEPQSFGHLVFEHLISEQHLDDSLADEICNPSTLKGLTESIKVSFNLPKLHLPNENDLDQSKWKQGYELAATIMQMTIELENTNGSAELAVWHFPQSRRDAQEQYGRLETELKAALTYLRAMVSNINAASDENKNVGQQTSHVQQEPDTQETTLSIFEINKAAQQPYTGLLRCISNMKASERKHAAITKAAEAVYTKHIELWMSLEQQSEVLLAPAKLRLEGFELERELNRKRMDCERWLQEAGALF